jgi:lysophospholipase L1-like esterase
MRILFLGHSLIEYGDWARLFPGHQVQNLGLAGETTAELHLRLDGVVAAHPRADVVAVMSGTNDILAGIDSFLVEYRLMARRLRRSYPDARIVLHGVPPVDPDWASPAALATANADIAQIAREMGVDFLDLTPRLADAAGSPRAGRYEADGVHLSEKGYRVWAEALAELLGT